MTSEDALASADARSWRELETRIGLDALPAFHRAFLSWRGIEDAAGMPLRRVSQRVEAELNRLVQSGQAHRQEDDWLIGPDVLDSFLAAQATGPGEH
ncbi:hypothetical protein Q0M94_10120 [Deinococcus radiomollis]|uniref:hypothetical protein n=1 Tax=Deinococcus radiomollis TaxID=468916 RepID=UPI00389249A1